jgi:outer membrane protein
MWNRFFLAGLVLMLAPWAGLAQEKVEQRLSLQACIDNGLENNPTVQITRNREEMARNNHSLQPFMPVLRGTARMNTSETKSELTFATGGERSFDDARSESRSAGLNFSWRLFDGLGMFATYNKSRASYSISEVQTRQTVENLVIQISTGYYQILVQQSRVDAAKKTLELSRERFRIVGEKVNIGSASGMDLQQAQLDFNADSSYLVRQKELLMNHYIGLNRLMDTELITHSYVSDTIQLGLALSLSDLEQATLLNNTTLLASQYGIRQSRAALSQARSLRYPTLDFITGYTYNRSESPASVLTFNESKGINYGFESAIPLFNGFQIHRTIKNASIELENSRLEYEEAHLEVMSELNTLYNTYLNNLLMVDFEKQNVEVSRANLNLALERYDLGALSGLGFREFQISYLNAVDRSLSAMYQAKVIELSLLVLSGQMDEFLMRIN